jgi:microcystin degradation protein MlrC
MRFSAVRYPEVRLGSRAHIGVISLQHECNSFAVTTTALDAFSVIDDRAALGRLRTTNTELAGATAELEQRGASVEPLLWAHALPSGPLEMDTAAVLWDRVADAIDGARTHLDALVLCLHGAATTTDGTSFDTEVVRIARALLGPDRPIALTLDLHANLTPQLAAPVQIVTGYRTNPHIDQAATGRRAAELLCATLTGALTPVISVVTCPALFPDETLRLPDGVLGEVLAPTLDTIPDGIVDTSVFPTQPWLDAAGIGFSVAAISDGDPRLAHDHGVAVCSEVWNQRERFAVPRLLGPDEALREVAGSPIRPVIITESADAPTAGATGDGPAMLNAVLGCDEPISVLASITDPAAVRRCHRHLGRRVRLSVGATLDQRWHSPVEIVAEVIGAGDGPYRLSGAGYTEMTVSHGAWAVVTTSASGAHLTLVITERPAWSGDRALWTNAGLDPDRFDAVIVRSCSDYLANYPTATATAIVADIMGATSSRLTNFSFERADPTPYPLDTSATFDPDAIIL